MAAKDQLLSSMKIKLKIPSRQEKADGVQEDEGDEVMITGVGNPTGPSSSAAAVMEKGGSSSGGRRKGADSKQVVGQKTCPICYRTFMNGKALGGHLRIHPHRPPPHFIGPSGTRSPNTTSSPATNPTKVKKKQLTDTTTFNAADYNSPGKYDSTVVMDHKDDVVYLHGDGVNQYNTITSTVCPVCDKEFKNLKSLFGHMKCHPEREWRGIQPPNFTTTACEFSTSVVVLNLQQNPSPSSGCNGSNSSSTHEPAGEAAATTRVRSAAQRRLRSLPGWGVTGKRGRKAVGINDHVWDHDDPDWIPQAACDLMWLAKGGISSGRENKRNSKLKMVDDQEKAPLIIRAIAYKDPFLTTTEAIYDTDSSFEYGKRSYNEIEDSETEGRSVGDNVDDYYYNGKGRKLANSNNRDLTEENTTRLGLLQAVYDSDDDEYWLQDHVLEPEYCRTGGITTTTTNKAVHVVNDSTGATTRSSGTPHNDEAAQHSTPSDKIIMSKNHNEKHPARKSNFIKNSESTSDHFTNNISASAARPAAVKFRCRTCKKTFPSYQALGGHRSSHYKERINNNHQLYR